MTTQGYTIANVFYQNNPNPIAAPVHYSFGGLEIGEGNIYANVGDIHVFGDNSTNFLEYKTSYILRNNDGPYEFIGRINEIIDANHLTLRTPAKVSSIAPNSSPTNYVIQVYNEEMINYDSNLFRFTDDVNRGNGTITVNTTNAFIFGTDTIFTKQLTIGSQVFANVFTAPQNTISPQYAGNELLGIVKNVYNDSKAEFTTICAYDLLDVNFRFFDPVTKNTSNVWNQDTHKLNTALLSWSTSGLIPNTTHIKSYHPPVQDPVTGMLVNFPATVIQTQYSGKRLQAGNLQPIGTLDNSPQVADHTVIKEFNQDNGIFGSSASKAINSIPINNFIQKLTAANTISNSNFTSTLINSVKQVYGSFADPVPPGLVVGNVPPGFVKIDTLSIVDPPYIAYQGPSANVVYVKNTDVTSLAYPTVADHLALAANFPPPQRIVNNRNDANSYYSLMNSSDQLNDAQKSDLSGKASNIFLTDDMKMVQATGVPAAIPGLMNVVLSDQDPSNRPFANVQYAPAYSYATNLFFNKDLPISAVNMPANVNVIAKGNYNAINTG
jgi:hypothetical protein